MDLQLPVAHIGHIGPVYQKRLLRLNIKTIEELLYHFPFRYQDYQNVKKIVEVIVGETVTLVGSIQNIQNIYTKNRKKITEAVLTDNSGSMRIIWFNQHFIIKTLKKGMFVSLSGKAENNKNNLVLVSPDYEIITNPENNETIHTGRLVPIYPETARVSSKWLRCRINGLLAKLEVEEFLPEEIRTREQFPELNEALKHIHFPKSLEEAQNARLRFAYQELFLIQLASLQRKDSWKNQAKSPSLPLSKEDLHSFCSSLPFQLTKAQQRTTTEILTDMEKTRAMNRLLEGEVGSGKTVVACIAALAAHKNGYQTVYMAPTEILALQHFETFKKLVTPFGLSVQLITGHHKTKEKTPAVIIGTHALLNKLHEFEKAGLMVIDEQHRFGVTQRALMATFNTKHTPHVLTMTATPIPRSLALTFYGELDLSIIDEMPVGRKKVKTFVTPKEKREKAYQWILEKIVRSGKEEQAFIIYPLIEESEAETMQDIKAATTEYHKLHQYFPKLKLGLLHGRLKSAEKKAVITEFQEKKIQILVSTSVVEVGIDIPSASIMIIEHADRFGLSQLHQLRGRVGRSDKESYCFLFTESRTPLTVKRLHALEKEFSGIKLAEIDLSLRGPGEVYGLRQHGLPELKVASITDNKLLLKTKNDALLLWQNDKHLDHYSALRDKLKLLGQTPVAPN